MTWPLTRGQVIRANIGLDEPKLLLVISNNRRNRQLRTVLAARLTTTEKPDIPSIVKLTHQEGFSGSVLCDDIEPVYDGEVLAVVGALSPSAMAKVDQGITHALALPAPTEEADATTE